MKVTNPQAPGQLPGGIRKLLEEQRRKRAFDPASYLLAKCRLLNAYLRRSKLSGCVVAVSGGLDSALTLMIADRARRMPDSPIERLDALLLPVHTEGATGQDEAVARGREVCRAAGAFPHIIDLTDIHALYSAAIEKNLGFYPDRWARGQLVAQIRTPAIYYATSTLTAGGFPAVVLGTTNRDEGSYLGYVGKASDGLVDLQVISDLHKSEVYTLAKHLGVPQSIIDVTPTGDMYDGRVDTEVFGAPYDFVELYLHQRCLSDEDKRRRLESLNDEERQLWDELSSHLDNLHSYNAHKYLVGSPAVHLDILESAVPGGWDGRESRGTEGLEGTR